MTRDLFKLFDSVGVSHDELVASEPQSLQDMSSDETEQDLIVERADHLLRTELKVDYSDFSNHVFFNSALDYFNITGEKILNEYPLDGTRADLENFRNELDGYQRHVLSVWPNRLGHLRFNPQVSSSYVQVDDVGQEDGVTKTCILSPGTGSITVEAWYESGRNLTGSNHVSILVQKQHPTTDLGYTLYLSGSSVRFRIASGSDSTEVSASAHVGTPGYVMAVLDRSSTSGTLAIYTGSLSRFPVLVQSSSVTFGGVLDVGSGSLYMGSGSLANKLTILYSGNLDDVRIWRQPLDLLHATSSYNRKNFARSSLVGLWRFNETGSTGLTGYDTVCYDHSGHRLNGRLRNYYSGLRGSGSLFYETPDPILDLRCPEVLSYVEEQQTSGSDYDSSNASKITDLVPAGYLDVESDQDADLVKNFLYILARHYDRLKLFADHLPKMLTVNYTDYDQVPDSKLEDAARFFGWELPGGFVDSSAIQYMLGRDVQLGELSNEEIEQNLYEIKVQFWRRVMNNLAHIYKTKGTRESVQALMRSYGVNEGFVRLKEYGYVNRHRLEAQRIKAEKSSYALQLGSGSLSGSVAYTGFLSSSLDTVASSSLNFAGSSSFVQFEQTAQAFPSGSTEMFTLMGARPKNIWPLQEAGGDGIVDTVAGERLGKISEAQGIMCGATASGFWYNGSFSGKRAAEWSGRVPNHVFSASLNNVVEPGSGSFAVLMVARLPQSGTTTSMLGKYYNAGGAEQDIGWILQNFDGSRIIWTVRDSPAGFATMQTTGSFYDDGGWHPIAAGRSVTSGTICIITDHEFLSTSAPLVTGSVANSALFRLGEGLHPATTGGKKMQIAYFAFFTGSDAEAVLAHQGDAVRKRFWTHASASSGMEYERYNDGVIYTEVGRDSEYGVLLAPYVTHEPGRPHACVQVPHLYSSGFSGSQSVGIVALPSYANFLPWPSQVGSWTHTNATTSPGATFDQITLTTWKMSPWRTYQSSVTTGSALNARVHLDTQSGVLTGSQWYCGSSYLRADVAHTCTLELQDTNGNVIQSKDVGITTVWERYHVSGVLPAASSSMRYAVYIGRKAVDSSAFTCIEGSQLNEGHYPLPLVSNNWFGHEAGRVPQRTALTGTYIKVPIGVNQVPHSAGRVDVLYRTFGHESISGSILKRVHPAESRRTLVDIDNSSTDVGRRRLFIQSGSNVRMGAMFDDTTTTYSLQMTASTTFDDVGTAIMAWNASQVTVPNLQVGNDGMIQGTSQSFTPGTNANTHIFVGHQGGASDMSSSLHLYGAVSRIVMYSGSILAQTTQSLTEYGFSVRDFSVESRVMWPTSGNMTMSGSEASGSLWHLKFRGEDSCDHHMQWRRTSGDAKTGSLILVVGSASLTMSNLPVFDDRWYNVYVVKETATGSYTMRVSRLDRDEVAYTTSSVYFSASMANTSWRTTGSITAVRVGTTGTLRSQQWMDEFRLWNKVLSSTEMDDHCLNYQSYGSDQSSEVRNLMVHWRLNDGTTANSAGALYVTDFSLNERHGTGSFASGTMPFRKFLNDYNYVASPDFSWTQNKVRIYDGKTVPRDDRPVDSRLLALEFNMIDQLNEDISQMNESLEEMNDAIGNAASVYRSEYRGLAAMRREYFRRLTDRLNFRVFVDMLDFFDRSFVNVVRKLIPARAIFMGDEVVVESHMLERPKHQYAYRPIKEITYIIEGVVKMIKR